MALLIDTPRWEWRGHLWAHMISDESLDELHAAARQLNLRWVAFGRDHYDVPDVLWPAACQIAKLVDSRVIVRSLRSTGLRVPGGKPKKSWQRLPELPANYRGGAVADWLHAIRPHFGDDVAFEVLGSANLCIHRSAKSCTPWPTSDIPWNWCCRGPRASSSPVPAAPHQPDRCDTARRHRLRVRR